MKPKEMQFSWPIIGHSQVKQYLQRSIILENLAHAYLFVGPAAVGKYYTATLFASSIFCTARREKRPCQKCVFCRKFNANAHPDFITVTTETEKQSISVDQIRALQHRLALSSFLSGYKIAIIRDAASMTEAAANALLKTLEEPTPKTIIILIADDTTRLLDTIISRCQPVRFSSVPTFQIENWLIFRGVPRERARRDAAYARGCPGRVGGLHERLSEFETHQNNIRYLINFFKMPQPHTVVGLAERLLQTVESADRTATSLAAVEAWLLFYRDALLSKFHIKTIANTNTRQQSSQLARRTDTSILLEIIQALLKARQLLRQSAQPRLVLEKVLLTMI